MDARDGATMDAANQPAFDGAGEPADAAVDTDPTVIVEDVVHVPDEATYAGTANIVWNMQVIIDTGDMTMGTMPTVTAPIWPMDDTVAFDVTAQEDTHGPELAVLHVGSLTVTQSSSVTVTGGRPLVILASGPIQVDGLIDASAALTEPGPGGSGSGEGDGHGKDGQVKSGWIEGGGGGAGFQTDGANGGSGKFGGETANGGDRGLKYGDAALTVLEGGSGGGAGGAGGMTPCKLGQGGAGGGAVQIYSATSISISGKINAGGGGGTGGGKQDACDSENAGGGGGSGGAIFLQAPLIETTDMATLAANGGGGGAGANADVADGADGQNGRLGTAPASGGPPMGNGSGGGVGGALGAMDMKPTDGLTLASYPQAGGGGGSVGHIVVMTQAGNEPLPGIFSPPARYVEYP